ncbi:MAG: right-handed parallel beta-helix repeat-containing protein [Saprospiraceae bacterium]|nr:right-handed parallel beta-helix repeat-containing protein [Saprospiraceae bacterium]
MLYTASEINAAGGAAGDILSVAFNVASRASQSMYGFTIQMQNTSATSLISTMVTSGLTTVYSSTYSVPSTGWQTINLTSPFAWDGSSNLLISVCFNNSSYTSSSSVYTSVVANSVSHNHTDGGNGCGFTTGGLYSNRPNIKLTIDPAAYNDVGISSITNPTSPVTPGVDTVKAILKNYGQVNLTSCLIKYSINGITQSTYNFSGSIAQNGTYGPITLGTVNFPVGNYEIKVWTELPNSVTDSNAFNDTATTNILSCQTFNGTYTIGGVGSNFTSFSAAISAINSCGISGPVVFNVASGIYLEQMNISTLPGASPTNTITFQSVTGDSTNVILAYSPTGPTDNYTIKLDGTDYIRFKKMTIKSYGSSYSRVIDIGNDANNNEFSNCVIDGVPTTGSSYNNAVIFSGNTIDDTLSFLNNHIKNGSYGIRMLSYSAAYLEKDLVVQGNIIEGFSLEGVTCEYQDGIKVIGNTITSASTAVSTIAIGNRYCDNGIEIKGNKILLNGTGAKYGIYLYYSDGSGSNKGLIANNMIAETEVYSGTATYGIFLYRSYNQKVFFNSIRLISTNNTSTALYVNDYSGIDILNNVFANMGSGYAAYINNGLSISFSDYNNFYSNGNYLAYWGGNHTTFSGLKTATGKDGNSKNIDPQFYSNNDLHSSSPGLNGGAIPIAVVPTDIDGETRSASSPDIGADEFTIPPNDAGVVEMVYPLANPCIGYSPIKVKIKNFGSTTLTSATINWKVNGLLQTPFSFTGSIAPNTTDTATIGSATFAANVVYSIKLWTSAPNSSTDGNPANDTLNKTGLVTALGGTLTVGFGGYSSISAVIADLALKGVCGPTIVNISPGFYSEQVVIPYIPGTNSFNTVTFQSSTGDSSNVIITATPTSSTNNYVIKLDSAQYTIVKSLTIQNGSSSYGTAIQLGNYCRNVTIRNNKLVGPAVSSTSTYFSVIYSYNSYEENITIENNRIQNGSIGIYSYQSSSPTDSYLIKGNKLINQYGYGVYLYNHINAETTENQIESSSYTGFIGIYYYYVDQNFKITKNIIGNNYTSQGIYLYYCDGTSTNHGLVANNFITLNTTGTSISGIYLYYVTYADFYHNSVNITGNYNSYYNRCFGMYGTINNLNIQNNIFANNASGMAFYTNVNYGYFVSDYNDFYTSGTSLIYDDYYNIYHPTISSWNSATGDDYNSVSINPQFLSSTNLHISNPYLKGTGIPVSSVTDDIDGETRSTTAPDMGADEFIIPAIDAGLVQFIEPSANVCVGSNPIKVELRNNGSDTLNSVTINWKVNNASQTAYSWSGSLALGETDTVTLGNYTFANSGTYSLSAWTYQPNSSTDLNNSNDTINLTNLQPALGGTLTIGGTGANYSTITAAINDLSIKGICGPVVLNIASGTYTEQLIIPTISGTSPTNTITFQSASGDSSNVIIQYNTNSSTYNYVINFNGADNFIFKNLTLKNISTGTYAGVIKFNTVTQNLKITNCQIIGRNVSDYNNSYALFYTTGYDHTGLTLSNNLFKYGSYAIYYYGTSSLTSGVNFINNSFQNQYAYGIYAYYLDAPIISTNEFNIVSGSYTSYLAMYLSYCDNAMQITKNKISSASNGGYGIYMYYCDGNSSSKGLIANNFIQLNTTSSAVYGIYTYYSTYQDFYYNSINITGSYASTNNVCMRYYGSSYPYFTIYNNIFSNNADGYCLYLYSSPSTSYFSSNYNNFTASGSYLNYWGGSRPTLATWQSYGGQDYNSYSVDPQFTSNSDLHIGNMLLNGKGTYVSAVTDDIDGDLRPSNPDIGADETSPGPPLAGIYTIGLDAADDFSSFTAAANAVSGRGISASVTFNVDSGSYNEQFEITDIPGTSSSKTVLFQSVTGDSSDVVVSFDASSTIDNYVVKIDGSDYVTLKNLTLKATDSYYSTVLNFNNDSNITIMNCKLEGFSASSTSNYAAVIQGSGTNNNITIKNNNILNGSYGFYWNGYSTSLLDEGMLIENNSISNQYYMGIYLINQDAPIIKNNTFNSSSTTYNYYYGMYLYYCDNDMEITGNKIINQSDGGYGIYARYCDGTSTNRGLIANNFISFTSNSYSSYGLYSYYNNYQDVFFNSIHIYGTYTSSYTYYLYGSSYTNGINIRNNNLTNTAGGYAIYANVNPTYYTNNNNNLYATGSYLAYEYGTNCTSLALWKSNSGEGYNSISINPAYISNTNLHVTNNLLNNTGTPIAGITTDIDGETRNTTTPDIGADEFTPAAYDIAIIELVSPSYLGCFSTNETVIVKLKNLGIQTIGFSSHPVTINVSVAGPNSTSFTPIIVNSGSVGPGNTLNVTITNSFNMSTSGSYVFTASAIMTGDGNAYNNNLSPVTVTNSSVNTFPLVEPFTTFPSSNTNFPNGWVGSSSNNSSYQWYADYSGTGTSYTGPYYDASNSSSGRYLYTESNYGNINDQAYFISPCIDISALTNPKMSFYYHMYGSTMGELAVDVLYNGLWIPQDSINGQQHTGYYDAWSEKKIDLNSYSGTIKVRFRSTKTSTGYYGDMAIDNIRISDFPVVNLGNDTGACAGQTVTLNAGGTTGFTYQWYKVGVTGLQNATQYFTVSTTGTYYVVVTNSLGDFDSDTINVTIANPVTPTISGLNSTYCTGDNPASLTGSPIGGVFAGSGISANTFNPSTAGLGLKTITYTYTDQYGCISLATQNTTVNQSPTVSLSGLSTTYCSNSPVDTAILSPTGGIFIGSGISGNTFNPSSAGVGTHSITYLYTAANGCSGTANHSITVNAIPTVSFSGLGTTYCDNAQAVSLIGNPSGGTFSGNGITGNIFNPSVAGSGTHSITYTSPANANGCSNSISQNVVVNTIPNVSISNLNNTYCADEGAITLSGTPSGGTFTVNGITATQFNPSISGAGTYTIVYFVTNANLCSNSDTVIVNVYPMPTVSFSGLATTYCKNGTPSTLVGVPSGGVFSGPGINGNIFNPANASIGSQQIIYTYTSGGSCTGSDTLVTLVKAIPNANAGNDATIPCGSGVGIGSASLPGYTYSWTPTTGLSNPNISNPIATLSVTTLFTLTVTDIASGCYNTDQVLITISGAPTVTAGPDTSICNGSSVTLSASNGVSYLWSTSQSTQSITVSPLISTVYTVTVYDALGCAGVDSVFVIVNQLPIANAGADTSITCGGSAVMIGSTQNPGYSYLWTPASTLSNPNIANPMANPLVSTVYTVTVTDTLSGCFATDDVLVSKTGGPTAIASNDTVICIGGTANLDVSGGTSYSWSTGDTTMAIQVTPTLTTIYVVTVTDGNCFDSDSVIVTVNNPIVELGNDTTICDNQSIILDAGLGFASYLWSDNSTGQTLTIDTTGYGLGAHTFSVSVTDIIGCTTNDAIEITFADCSGINEINDKFNVKLYPNPTKGLLNLDIDGKTSAKMEFCLLNLQGQIIWCETLEKSNDRLHKEIDLSIYPKGIYYLRINDENNITVKKVIIQ